MQTSENITPAQTLRKIKKRSSIKIIGFFSAGLGLLFLSFGFWQMIKKPLVEETPEVYQQAELNFIPDKYLIKIKGSSHRKIKFCEDGQDDEKVCQRTEGIDLEPEGSYILDFTGHPLEFGDVYPQDGIVGVQDYSFVKACREGDAKKGDENYEEKGCRWADANLNGVVESADIDLLFNTLKENPDDE